jgi:DNA-binding response OmpR family regulator
MKILICDDDRIILKSTELKLKREGYETMTAPDGKKANELFENNKFDLLIIDLLMPYINGFELISFIRKKRKSIPIIVLSSVGLEETVLNAFKLGADDYIVKPFSLNELSIRIRRLLPKKLTRNNELINNGQPRINKKQLITNI